MPKKEGIRKLFDSIAPEYDRLNHLLSLDIDKRWRRKAIAEAVCPGKAQEILDVACGTGDFTIGTAMAAAEGSRVTGIDLSEGMLDIGRKKAAQAGLGDKIEMVQGDCESLPYQDHSFDRVTVAFGVRNFEHLDIGLKEMLRVLKPGGKAVILELSTPQNPVLNFLYRLYFLHILPAIGGLVSGDKGAYRYLPASVIRFPGPAEFMRLMSECGYTDVRHMAFTCGICRMYTGIRKETL